MQRNVGEREVLNAFSCELEDWFHILASDKAPRFEDWPKLTLLAERNVEKLLQLFEETGTKATFFCLGWMAERMPNLIRKCRRAGHEIASHGYAHLLAYEVGPKAFQEDIVHSKEILEDITGEEVTGFRSAGFGVKENNKWVFDVVIEAGFKYDASVFPAHHGHGGLNSASSLPYFVNTRKGPLIEIPASTIKLLHFRFSMFGGGYLRISPLWSIKYGVKKLSQIGQPLIIYIHPREIDPAHPRLPLGLWRNFKSYINIEGTMKKLNWLCTNIKFTTMRAIAEQTEKVHAQNALFTHNEENHKALGIVEIGTHKHTGNASKNEILVKKGNI